jgi:transcriptional regulator with XRE-family HTH domain
MNTSEKLAALIEKGWTQSAISEETGVPQGTISRIASGEHKDPRASNAYAIDRLFERICNDKEAA